MKDISYTIVHTETTYTEIIFSENNFVMGIFNDMCTNNFIS